MPTATTSSPFCRASSIDLCSFAFFICGRIITKYRMTNIRMMGRKLIISPPCALPPACANALPIMGAWGTGKPEILTRGEGRPRGGEGGAEGAEPTLRDGIPQPGHQLQVVVQVVDRIQARTQDLVGAV